MPDRVTAVRVLKEIFGNTIRHGLIDTRAEWYDVGVSEQGFVVEGGAFWYSISSTQMLNREM